MLSLAVGEDSADWRDTCLVTRSLHGIDDNSHLGPCLNVIDRLAGKRSNDDRSFLVSVMGEQPSWRFWESQHQNNDDDSKCTLEGDRESPNHVVRSIQTSVIDPVCDKRSDSDISTFNANELSTVVRSAAFCLIRGHSRSVDSIAYSCYATSDDELGGSSSSDWDSSDLDNDSDNHDRCAEEDRLATAQPVAECENEAGSQEAANGVNSCDETFVGTASMFDFGEIVQEVLRRDDATHHTLSPWICQSVGPWKTHDRGRNAALPDRTRT